MLTPTPKGLYCAAGDFHVDPPRGVKRAVITHAHSDHARTGSAEYFCAASCEPLLRGRIGADARIFSFPYGQPFKLGRALVTFHPAGHILGSAQVAVQAGTSRWIVSGDYKRSPDPSCEPFQVVECDTFITEATFGLPVYRWPSGRAVAEEILAWWETNRALGKTSVLFGYALGKAERIIAELGALAERPIFTHGAVEKVVEEYRAGGMALPRTIKVGTEDWANFAGELVVAPPGAGATPWMRRLGDTETAFLSGWMRVRKNRARRGQERGFVLSDHADWPELLDTIAATKAKTVLVTHGYTAPLVKYLRERGTDARPL